MNATSLTVLSAIVLLCVSANAQPLTVSGLTHQWQGGAQYAPLPDVKVVVSRGGSIVKTATSDLNADGEAEYGMVIGSGEPIQVVFHLSKQYLPEMQSLSARAGDSHRLSAALLTIKQYQEMRGANPNLPTVREKLQCVLHFVPKESPLFDEIVGMLQQF